jgi:opacity protein-like surface antigen
MFNVVNYFYYFNKLLMLWSDFMKKLVNFLKKPVIAAGVFGLAVASSGVASADYFDNVKFYVGAGLDYAKYGINKNIKNIANQVGGSIKDKGMGVLVPILGVKFHENFGIEAGYSFNRKISLNFPQQTVSVKVRNAYLDFMGFMPVADQCELIGGLGIGKLMAKKGQNFDNNFNNAKIKNKFGIRAKLGAQYNFNSNIGARALVTYQTAGSKIDGSNVKVVKNIKSIGLAAVYTI